MDARFAITRKTFGFTPERLQQADARLKSVVGRHADRVMLEQIFKLHGWQAYVELVCHSRGSMRWPQAAGDRGDPGGCPLRLAAELTERRFVHLTLADEGDANDDADSACVVVDREGDRSMACDSPVYRADIAALVRLEVAGRDRLVTFPDKSGIPLPFGMRVVASSTCGGMLTAATSSSSSIPST